METFSIQKRRVYCMDRIEHNIKMFKYGALNHSEFIKATKKELNIFNKLYEEQK